MIYPPVVRVIMKSQIVQGLAVPGLKKKAQLSLRFLPTLNLLQLPCLTLSDPDGGGSG
jgi:hypothetical protein